MKIFHQSACIYDFSFEESLTHGRIHQQRKSTSELRTLAFPEKLWRIWPSLSRLHVSFLMLQVSKTNPYTNQENNSNNNRQPRPTTKGPQIDDRSQKMAGKWWHHTFQKFKVRQYFLRMDGVSSKWPPVLKVREQLRDNQSKVRRNCYRQNLWQNYSLKCPRSSATQFRSRKKTNLETQI